jgi:putative DNA primase/helicase
MNGQYDFGRCGEGWGWKPHRGNRHVVEYLRSCGLNVMPLSGRGSRIPKIQWSGYQHALVPDDILYAHFSRPWSSPSGIGVICGPTSGDLEVLDFDGWQFFDWMDRVEDEIGPDFRSEAVIVETPSEGNHFYYRCPVIEGNRKLAFDAEGNIQIETRGRGGMAVMPGSASGTHPSGRPYLLVHGSFDRILVVTPERREVFLEMAKSFDERPAVAVAPPAWAQEEGFRSPDYGDRPGDQFNVECSWGEILEPRGWSLAHVTGRTLHWRRPGKWDSGSSATTGHCTTEDGLDLLHVFSTSAAPFESEKSYTKFHAYTLLYHGGDFRSAAESLAAQGYGSRASLTRDEEEVDRFFREYYS